jgi:pimeloyl-ACP methyl ester carboxylesterase
MPNVAVNGVTIEYHVRGSGEPLLLVMGLAGQLIDWPDEFVDLFVDRGYQVIRFDNRDIGLSTQTSGKPPSQWKLLFSAIFRRRLKSTDYTLTDMANDAAGLLGALGIDRAHVLGISMGGMIAQELAIEHPGKVKSLCSIMSNTGDRKNGGIAASLLRDIGFQKPPTRETALEQQVVLFRAVSGPHFDEETFRPFARASIARSFTPDGVARQSGAIAGSRDRTELLGSVTAPTLVIHGLVDPLVKPSGGIATAQAIPGSRLLAFGDMGHDLPRPRWEEIRDAVVHNAARASSVDRLHA